MTIAIQLRSLEGLTTTDRKVARNLLSNYPMAGLETVATFSQQAGVSGPSVLRFVGKLGFDNYADFQRALRAELQKTFEGPAVLRESVNPTRDRNGIGHEKLAAAIQTTIDKTVSSISRSELQTAVKLLCSDSSHVYLIGGRFTEVLARHIFLHLREVRPNVTLVEGQATAWPDYLLDMKPKDTVVVFDIRRYQQDLFTFSKQAKLLGANVVLFTDEFMSPISSLAKVIFNCWVSVPSLWDSSVSIMTVVELVIAAITEKRLVDVEERSKKLDQLREATSATDTSQGN